MPSTKFSSVFFLTALACASFLITPTSAAPTQVAVDDYSLTFPDGWVVAGTPTSTLVLVLDQALGDLVNMMGDRQSSPLTDTLYFHSIHLVAERDTLIIDSTGHKTIGGKDFFFAETRDRNPDSLHANLRFREYATQASGYLVTLSMSYNVPDTLAISNVETALASLALHPVITGIRIPRETPQRAVARSLDALGRRIPLGNPARIRRVASSRILFARP